ncbi:thioredoxin family protein [Candidatus Altiarchaeota archaeon]
MRIEILGSGCPKCGKLEENARQAVAEAGVDAEIVKIEDVGKILSYDVMMLPALVIDGIIKCSGRIASVEEIIGWIKGG